jgi:dihydroxyacid dehydratase/phosphogluconate dehydratase
MKNQGLAHHLFDGRPVIGICNTWSELTPCNAHFRELAEYVKRGVYEAAGFPLEFPVMSLGETNLRPTAMMFRNLVSMDVEESIRGNPIDGVVLLCGCDKTTPALMMGAASCNVPALVVSGGAMLNGCYRGQRIVGMVREDLTMEKILTRDAFENAIRANAAIGGSTNAVNHLIALAGRVGVDLHLADFELGSDVPCLLNLQPSGEFLMEDFYYAGGLPVILRELGEAGLLHN